MSKKCKQNQKSNRDTTYGSSACGTRQPPNLTAEEIAGIREKLSPYRHNRHVERLYKALIPN